MAWKKAVDPNAPVAPTFQHPRRCMNCGHLDAPDNDVNDMHDPEVGCLVEGGTKYITNELGVSMYVCSCEKYIAPLEMSE